MKNEKSISKRLAHFQDRVANHILYKRLAQKMSETEFDECVAFIEEHDHLDHLQFEYAVLRMHLDRAKPKNWTMIQELTLMSNGCLMTPRFRGGQ